MVEYIEDLIKKLKLPLKIQIMWGRFRIPTTLTYDFETYSAGQDKWLDDSSNFETFQANRLKLRYRRHK